MIAWIAGLRMGGGDRGRKIIITGRIFTVVNITGRITT